MVQPPVPSGPQGMMVAPVGRPGAGPQQPGAGPMNPNQPGQSKLHVRGVCHVDVPDCDHRAYVVLQWDPWARHRVLSRQTSRLHRRSILMGDEPSSRLITRYCLPTALYLTRGRIIHSNLHKLVF